MPVYEYYCDKCKRDVRVTLSSGKIKARLSNQSEFFDSWFPHRPAPNVRATITPRSIASDPIGSDIQPPK